jgi:hypothetical protein
MDKAPWQRDDVDDLILNEIPIPSHRHSMSVDGRSAGGWHITDFDKELAFAAAYKVISHLLDELADRGLRERTEDRREG